MIPADWKLLHRPIRRRARVRVLNTETFVTRWSFLPLRRRRGMGRTVWKTNNRKEGLNQRSGGQVLDRTLVGRIALLQRKKWVLCRILERTRHALRTPVIATLPGFSSLSIRRISSIPSSAAAQSRHSSSVLAFSSLAACKNDIISKSYHFIVRALTLEPNLGMR
jgi:hypothetical protein